MLHPTLFAIAITIGLLAISIEFMIMGKRRKTLFSKTESLISLSMMLGHRLSGFLLSSIPLSIYFWVWQYRLWTVPMNSVGSIALLFVGLEFFYYWQHRASHEIRWFWATHAVHHSAEHLNLSAAYRLGWTGLLSGNFIFFLPLCWLGFHPIAIAIGLSLNLLYQFWIHTELIPKLGWLEWFLNTPSHHRVHHASNSEYIDRNYGGVLIIFDRLFGTLTVEQSRPIYGLTYRIPSHNPITIAFYEWRRLFQDLIQAKTWGDRTKVMFGKPV